MSELLARLAEQQRPDHRRTALPAHTYERPLTCTDCGELVSVFEAATGARIEDDHRFLDPDAYVCGRCLFGGDE